MSGYSLSEISEWICADKKLFGTVNEIVTDSRKITPGCLFIALEGEFFDGHRFITGYNVFHTTITKRAKNLRKRPCM